MHVRHAARLLTLSLMLGAPTMHAAEEDTGVWLAAATAGRFASGGDDPRWRYAVEGQYRYFALNDGFDQYLFRPTVGYDLNDSVSGWLGYVVVHTDRDNARDLTEQRIWQQLEWKAAHSGPSRLTLRARLIERWRNDGDDLALTLRFRAHYARPLDNGFSLVAYAEPWFDFRDTDWGTEERFSQMRVSGGVAFPARDWGRLEIGYLNQRLLSETRRDISNHLLYVSFNLNL
jgi:hypothetical protein